MTTSFLFFFLLLPQLFNSKFQTVNGKDNNLSHINHHHVNARLNAVVARSMRDVANMPFVEGVRCPSFQTQVLDRIECANSAYFSVWVHFAHLCTQNNNKAHTCITAIYLECQKLILSITSAQLINECAAEQANCYCPTLLKGFYCVRPNMHDNNTEDSNRELLFIRSGIRWYLGTEIYFHFYSLWPCFPCCKINFAKSSFGEKKNALIPLTSCVLSCQNRSPRRISIWTSVLLQISNSAFYHGREPEVCGNLSRARANPYLSTPCGTLEG